MGRKLWLFTGGALAISLVIIFFSIFVRSFRPESAGALIIIVLGIWAGLGIFVLLAEARRTPRLVVGITLALAVTLSFATRWFGFVAYMVGYFGLILFIGAVLFFAVLRLFRKKPSLRALVIPLTMTLMGSCGIFLSALSSKPVPPLPQRAMSISDELKYIYGTDQSDRFTMYMMIDPERDQIRLQRVKALYRAGKITEPIDRYHAGFVYQHGSCADDFQAAYELFKAAVGPGVPKSYPPPEHLAYDRWQMSLGRQQTYGTQLFPMPIRRPCPPAQ